MDKFLTSGTVSELCLNKVMLCAVLEYVYGLACPVKIDGEELVIVKYNDILAIVE